MKQTIYLGAGCFWGVEKKFTEFTGVTNTAVGYSGGHFENPSYEDVCQRHTGHAEVCCVEFDETIISFTDLLNFFWKIHNPTTLNRQGLDIGTQYRSIILYLDERQRIEAEKQKKILEQDINIVTEIVKFKRFWLAEKYHQKHLFKS